MTNRGTGPSDPKRTERRNLWSVLPGKTPLGRKSGRKAPRKLCAPIGTLLLWPLSLLIGAFLVLNTLLIYYSVVGQLRQMARENLADTLSQTVRFLGQRLEEVGSAFYRLDYANRRGLDFCAISPDPQRFYSNYLLEVSQELQSAYFDHYELLDAVYLYIDRDDLLICQASEPPTRFLVNPTWWKKYGQGEVQWRLQLPHQYVLQTSRDRKLAFSLFRIYHSRYDNITTLLQFDMRTDYVAEILDASGWASECSMLLLDGERAVAFDEAGRDLLRNTNLQEALSTQIERKQGSFSYTPEGYPGYLVLYDTLDMAGWQVVACVPERSLEQRATRIATASVLVLLLLLLLSLLLASAVVRRVTGPLTRMASRIEGIGEEGLDITFEEESCNAEVQLLSEKLNFLVGHCRQLVKRVRLQQELKRRAEFTAMQAQIKPHFLYNALYAIQQLCDMQETQRAGQMVRELANFYRIGVNNTSGELTLEQEFAIARSYLELSRLRYGERLQYQLELPEDCRQYSILKMTLQPLIENCIKHGFGEALSPLAITLRATCQEGRLLLSVQDDGCGMSPQRLAMLRSWLETEPDAPEEARIGIGLCNVHRRLQMFYGAQAGLAIESTAGEGTLVEIRLPAVHGNIAEV